MSASLVRTVVDPAGWPTAGTVVDDGHGPARMPVLLGDAALWSNDPAWWRAFATAAVACANTLEALAGSAVPPVEEPLEDVERLAGRPPYEDPTPTGAHPQLSEVES